MTFLAKITLCLWCVTCNPTFVVLFSVFVLCVNLCYVKPTITPVFNKTLYCWLPIAYSPILGIAEYKYIDYFDGTKVPVCHTLANTFWSALYFLSSIFLFFIVPLIILLVLYCIIAKNLISNTATLVLNVDSYSVRARRQVILMLGTVVLSFFLCLIPFRVFTLWIILGSEENLYHLGVERYYNILYFCRIMVYLNSAANPILYNLMSSKFRSGFAICSEARKKFRFSRSRNGTFSTTVSSNCRSSSNRNSHEGFRVTYRPRNSSVFIRNFNDSPNSSRSSDSPRSNILKESPVCKHSSFHCIDEEDDDSDKAVNNYNNDKKQCTGYSIFSERVIIYPDIHTSSLQSLFDKDKKKSNIKTEKINLHEKLARRNNKNEEESYV